jgi:hypothetical protein
MDTFRLNVSPRGKGYVAKSGTPGATALGSTPEEAVESARLMALAVFGKGPRPTTLIVYLSMPGVRTIIMQPMDRTFTLAAIPEKANWRYMASVSNDASITEAAGE